MLQFQGDPANGSEPPEKKIRLAGSDPTICRACLGVLQESVMQPALEKVNTI